MEYSKSNCDSELSTNILQRQHVDTAVLMMMEFLELLQRIYSVFC